jgi:DNA polymerase (family 10)
MASTNAQLAAIFERMAEIEQILGDNPFRVNAFSKAARVVGDLTQDVAQIGPDMEKLMQIEGIGKGIAQRICEFLTTGRIKEHDDLLKKVPKGLPGLLEVPGLGPKTVALLWKHAGIEDVEGLKERLKEGDELAQLPGMGAKKLENLRKSLTFAETAHVRVRIGQALPVAVWLVEQLRKVKGVKRADYAGSLRRGKETIGDIDLLVGAEEGVADEISGAFVQLRLVTEVLARGPTKSSVRMDLSGEGDGPIVQADLRIVGVESYGAALLYFTGSKEFNVALRQRAIDRGWRLNEYGLFDGKRMVAGGTEEEVFKKLGLPWLPPEMREDRGELAQAEKGKLPALIELDDIRAELHAHTTASDGRWSVRELALAAAERGFHTVAVTDHSKSQVIANGLSEQRLQEHIEEVRRVARELKGTVTVLAGSEVDILADGSLDYPDSLLQELDVVVAAPHVGLSQEPAKATARLIRAIENPYVTILAHPTGRLIGRREGLSPDMKEVIAAAARRGVALELNANSWRLDLRDTHARMAIEAGVKLAINTDAHGPGDLDQLMYGVLTARRAGVTKKDVINCMSRAALARWVKATRV